MAYKPKFKYRVTAETVQMDEGYVYSSDTKDCGITWASSEAQAINNIKFRTGIKNNYSEGWGGYSQHTIYKAERI